MKKNFKLRDYEKVRFNIYQYFGMNFFDSRLGIFDRNAKNYVDLFF